MSKEKDKTPKVGDTVYLKEAKNFKARYYQEQIIREGTKYAKCTSVVPKLKGETEYFEEVFKIEDLTLNPPSEPTQVFKF